MLQKHAPLPGSFPAYASYNEGSVEGYRGESKADFFPADFDREDDPAKALQDARRTVRRWEVVYELPPEALRYFFSGAKGFHIEIPEWLFGGLEPGRDTAARLEALASEMLKESETADFDIYQTLRLWRAPNTRHRKTGLYKVPLYPNEFFNFDIAEIHKLAGERRDNFVHTDPGEFEPVPELSRLWRKSKDHHRDERHERLDTTAILNGVPEGERDTTLFKLACKLRRADVPQDLTEALILKAAANCEPPFPEQEALKKVANAYAKYPAGNFVSSLSSPPYIGDDSDDTALKVINAKDFPEETDPTPCVVDKIVPEHHITSFYGAAGTTKSILILSLLLAAARGDRTWLGLPMGGEYKCLFIDFELDLEAQARRTRQLVYGVGESELPENFNYLAAAGKDPREVFTHAYGFCKDHKIRLIAIDSAGLAMTGDAGAYRDVVDFFQKTLDRFRVDIKCTVILIDHQANIQAGESYQSKGAFGSSYKGNLSRSRVQVQQEEATKGTRRITLRHNKANFTDYVDPFEVEVRFHEDKIELEARGKAASGLAQEQTLPAWKRAMLALDALGEPMDRKELAAAAGVTYGTIGNVLSKLRGDGYIKDCETLLSGRKTVELTNDGKRFVERFLAEYRDRVITSPAPYTDDDNDEPPDTTDEGAGERLPWEGEY